MTELKLFFSALAFFCPPEAEITTPCFMEETAPIFSTAVECRAHNAKRAAALSLEGLRLVMPLCRPFEIEIIKELEGD